MSWALPGAKSGRCTSGLNSLQVRPSQPWLLNGAAPIIGHDSPVPLGRPGWATRVVVQLRMKGFPPWSGPVTVVLWDPCPYLGMQLRHLCPHLHGVSAREPGCEMIPCGGGCGYREAEGWVVVVPEGGEGPLGHGAAGAAGAEGLGGCAKGGRQSVAGAAGARSGRHGICAGGL